MATAKVRGMADYSYTLKGLDRELWRKVKSKAALQSLTLKALIEQLLRVWLKEK